MKTHEEFLNTLGENPKPRFQRKWDPASHFGEEQELIKEPVHLVAPAIDEMVRSYTELTRDMSAEFDRAMSPQELNRISYYYSKFFVSFIEEAKKLGSADKVEEFATLCKQRRNSLQQVTEFLSENNYQFYPNELTLVTKLPTGSSAGYEVDLTKLHYTPNNIQGVIMWLDRDDLLADAVTIREHPRFYIYLYRILFELVIWCNNNASEPRLKKDIISQMLMTPCGAGSIFEKMNPDTGKATDMMKSVVQKLRETPSDLPEEFVELYQSVINDLHSKRPLPYISELRRTLKRYWKLEKSDISNFYATLKAAPQGVFEVVKHSDGELFLKQVYKYPSLLNSIIEVDPFEESDITACYDSSIEYVTNFRQLQDMLDDTLFQDSDDHQYVYFHSGVMTIFVPNPGKYKGRLIHLACNALQDRLSPIHLSLKRVFKQYTCDCTYNHKRGIDFLKQETDPDKRREEDIKHNVFVSDFTNATDTLNQEFQEMVIRDVLEYDALASFWGEVSRMEKLAVYPDGTWELYVQSSGQPQGIICSFDFFALAHHILILMLMKATDNVNILASSFYRILGDDSIISYPVKEDGIDAYDVHTWLCEIVNLDKNDQKTGKSFYPQNDPNLEPNKIILDFAKISVFEGEFCSSLPAGLGLYYGSRNIASRLGVLIWYAEQGLKFPKWAHQVLSEEYIKDHTAFLFAESIWFGGHQDFLTIYKDPDVISCIGEDLVALANFIYSRERLKRSYLGFFFSDKVKKEIYKGTYSMESISKYLHDPDYQMLYSQIPDNHKYNILAQDNENTANLVAMLYEEEFPDEEKLEIFERLFESRIDTDNFVFLTQFNDYVMDKLKDPDYNLEDFVNYDSEYFFGHGFHDRTLHIIKGGREKADAMLFKRSGKEFKSLVRQNRTVQSYREQSYESLVSLLCERYFN
jgi:hypothetical protein